jgi:hypothetical protein
MTDTDGYIVRLLKLGISATAGHSGPPYDVKAHIPVFFDFDVPQVRLVESSHRQTQPTIFKSKEEAEEKVGALLDRLKAIQRNTLRTGRHANVGAAMELLGKRVSDKVIGGYEIVPAKTWLNEVGEERRLDAQARQEELAEKEAAAAVAEMTAASLREEIEAGEFGSAWKSHSEPGIQHRTTKKGEPRFRGRKHGNTSPTYETVEEAVQWIADMGALESRMLAKR